MKKVLCIGDAAYYVIVSGQEGFVRAQGRSRDSEISLHAGGCASGTAMCLARLGVETTLCTRIGADREGRMLVNAFNREGVNTQYITYDEKQPTTAAMVFQDSSGRVSVMGSRGSTCSFEEQHVSGKALAETDIVFIGGALSLGSFDDDRVAWMLRNAHKRRKFTALDTSWDFDGLWMEKAKYTLPFLDLFMCGREEGRMLTGKTKPERMADVLFDAGARNVIIKLGKEGALVCPAGLPPLRVPAYECTPVDCTGAGDAFVAGVLVGLAMGENFYQSARWGNAVARFSLLHRGVYEGVPNLETVKEFLLQNERAASQQPEE